MKLRWGYIPLAAVLGVLAAILPAIASSETSPTVEAVNTGAYSEEHHSWSPSQVSVLAGGVVTFSNPTTVPHGVEWIGKPTCTGGVPVGTTPAASGTKWSGTCTFAEPGIYTFYCTVHGPSMAGKVTVNANGTTTVTTQTPPTSGSTGTTTTPATKAPTGPLEGAPVLRSTQHGTSVHGSLDISRAGAGDRLEIDLLVPVSSLAKARHVARVRVGRFVKSSVTAGKLSFEVALSSKGKRALRRKHRLGLIVKIALTPYYGETTTLSRSVTLRR